MLASVSRAGWADGCRIKTSYLVTVPRHQGDGLEALPARTQVRWPAMLPLQGEIDAGWAPGLENLGKPRPGVCPGEGTVTAGDGFSEATKPSWQPVGAGSEAARAKSDSHGSASRVCQGSTVMRWSSCSRMACILPDACCQRMPPPSMSSSSSSPSSRVPQGQDAAWELLAIFRRRRWPPIGAPQPHRRSPWRPI